MTLHSGSRRGSRSRCAVPRASGTAGRAAAAAMERLEPRRLFCADLHSALAAAVIQPAGSFGTPDDTIAIPAGGFAAAVPEPTLPGLPTHHSLPGGPAAVYLDFNGFGTNTPYDVDGDDTSF